MLSISYTIKSFDELSTTELYEILQLRIQVFVIEQNCSYQDADGKDNQSYHLMGRDANGDLQTYTRLVPAGVSYEGYTSIGRVVTSEAVRGQKAGVKLMEVSMEEIIKLWPGLPVKISAQSHLQRFYRKFGFESIGEEYLEDDIPHIAMVSNQ